MGLRKYRVRHTALSQEIFLIIYHILERKYFSLFSFVNTIFDGTFSIRRSFAASTTGSAWKRLHYIVVKIVVQSQYAHTLVVSHIALYNSFLLA